MTAATTAAMTVRDILNLPRVVSMAHAGWRDYSWLSAEMSISAGATHELLAQLAGRLEGLAVVREDRLEIADRRGDPAPHRGREVGGIVRDQQHVALPVEGGPVDRHIGHGALAPQ